MSNDNGIKRCEGAHYKKWRYTTPRAGDATTVLQLMETRMIAIIGRTKIHLTGDNPSASQAIAEVRIGTGK